MMKRVMVVFVAAALMVLPEMTLAQSSGSGPAQAPTKGQTQPAAPMVCPVGSGPCAPGTMPCMQMMQQMQQTLEQMQQVLGHGKMTPEAMKQMQDLVAKMQGMMQQCPMIQKPGAPPPPPAQK